MANLEIPPHLRRYTEAMSSAAMAAADMSVLEAERALVAATGARKAAEDFFAPMVKSAYAAHKAATKTRDSVVKPIKGAEDAIRARLSELYQAQEKDDGESVALVFYSDVTPSIQGLPSGSVTFQKRLTVEVTDPKAAVMDIITRGEDILLDILSIDKKKLANLYSAAGNLKIAGVKAETKASPVVRLENSGGE